MVLEQSIMVLLMGPGTYPITVGAGGLGNTPI